MIHWSVRDENQDRLFLRPTSNLSIIVFNVQCSMFIISQLPTWTSPMHCNVILNHIHANALSLGIKCLQFPPLTAMSLACFPNVIIVVLMIILLFLNILTCNWYVTGMLPDYNHCRINDNIVVSKYVVHSLVCHRCASQMESSGMLDCRS